MGDTPKTPAADATRWEQTGSSTKRALAAITIAAAGAAAGYAGHDLGQKSPTEPEVQIPSNPGMPIKQSVLLKQMLQTAKVYGGGQ